MAQLHIIYDEQDYPPRMASHGPGFTAIVLGLPGGTKGKDLYDVARRLAELLLEQVARDGESG